MARTCRKPRASRPAVMPAIPLSSSMRTLRPRTDEEFSSKRFNTETLAAVPSSPNARYSRSSDFSKAAQSSTRDHSVPVSIRNEVANLAQLRRKLHLVDVDAHAHHQMAHPRCLGIHLGENAAKFLAAEQQIVRPFQVRQKLRGNLGHRRAHRQSRRQRKNQRIRGRHLRTQDHRTIDPLRPRRMPGMRAASAPSQLFFGEKYAAFRRALRRGPCIASELVEPIL